MGNVGNTILQQWWQIDTQRKIDIHLNTLHFFLSISEIVRYISIYVLIGDLL